MNVYLLGMIISMVVYLIMGFVISKSVKNANDYYVAGRQAPTLLIVGSLVASYCSTGAFMGDAGEAYDGFFVPFMITIAMLVTGYVLGSVFFGKYLRRSEVLTIPQFFGKRFCSRKLQILAAITALVIYLVYMLSIMQGIGILMNTVTGLDYNLCIALALATFTILTLSSGSKGVLITDTLMFSIFTIAAIISGFIFISKAGGFQGSMEALVQANADFFSWHGNLNHLYPTGAENMVWAVATGLTWITVCMVGPWQASRYLMAKNEHTVVRSSVFAALGVFLIEFIIAFSAVVINRFNPDLTPSNVLLWGAMNLLPTFLGVLLLTGVLAAGISSATTFMSLISSSIANDILVIPDDAKKVRVGKIAVAVGSLVILLLSIFNPPNIYIIMCLSGTVVACSWFPVCMASIWSKRVTKTGAFAGMLAGFVTCATIKIAQAAFNLNIPIYFDAFFMGILANVAGIVIGSALTKVSPEEQKERALLFAVPKAEANENDIRITNRFLVFYLIIGILITAVLLWMWAIPFTHALG